MIYHGSILISFVWCQCTVATIDELIIMRMTAFQHKYSNISTKHEINMVQYAKNKKKMKKDVPQFYVHL